MSHVLRTLCLTVALVAFACVLAPSHAAAQDGFFLDDRAAVTAGAVTATTRGSGGIWYNPAGIGGIQTSSLDLSGSAFRLQMLDVDRFMRVTAGETTETGDASFTTFVSAPSVLSYVRRLGDSMSIAFGVFTRDLVDIEFRQSVVAEGRTALDAPLTSTLALSVSFIQSRQLGALALGWALADNLRIGVGAYVSYESTRLSITSLVASTSSPDEVPVPGDFIGIDHRAGLERFLGGMLVAGVQWRPADLVSLGLVVRSPHQAFFVLDDVSDEGFAGAQTDAYRIGFRSDPVERSEFAWDMIEPMRVHLATAFHVGDGTLSAEADARLPFTDRYDQPREFVINGRLGAWFPVVADVGLGGGLYTDFRDRSEPDAFGDMPVTRYGATFGGAFDTAFALSDHPDATALRMSTTIALQYALGLGDVGGLHLDREQAVNQSASIVFHEMAAHIGTSIKF